MYCAGCNKDKQSTDFSRAARAVAGGQCRDCNFGRRVANWKPRGPLRRPWNTPRPPLERMGEQWASGYVRRMGYPRECLNIEPFTKADVIERWGGGCWHCARLGECGEFEELDHHPVPIRHGGSHTLENVRPSCRWHNASEKFSRPA